MNTERAASRALADIDQDAVTRLAAAAATAADTCAKERGVLERRAQRSEEPA